MGQRGPHRRSRSSWRRRTSRPRRPVRRRPARVDDGSTRDGATLSLKSQFTAGPQRQRLTAIVTVSTGTISSARRRPVGRAPASRSTATYTYTATSRRWSRLRAGRHAVEQPDHLGDLDHRLHLDGVRQRSVHPLRRRDAHDHRQHRAARPVRRQLHAATASPASGEPSTGSDASSAVAAARSTGRPARRRHLRRTVSGSAQAPCPQIVDRTRRHVGDVSSLDGGSLPDITLPRRDSARSPAWRSSGRPRRQRLPSARGPHEACGEALGGDPRRERAPAQQARDLSRRRVRRETLRAGRGGS